MRRERVDAVVVGAGLGGLSAAAHLARTGLRVAVLEHHSVPGGYAHEFHRRGYRFEVALHALDGAGPGGWIRPLLENLGVVDRIDLQRLDPFYVVRFPDHEVTAHANPDAYRADLVEAFPESADAIDDFFAAVRRVSHDTGRYAADRARGERGDASETMKRYPDMVAAMTSTWADFVGRYVRDHRLAAVLSTLWGYFGLPPSRLCAGALALAIDSYHRGGAWYPHGGSQAISRALAAVVEENGGSVHYRQTVNHIEVRDGSAVAVGTERGLRVEADLVISNASPDVTCGWVEGADLPPAYTERFAADVPALSNLVVYLGVGKDLATKGWDHHEYFHNVGYDLEADYRAVVTGNFSRAGLVLSNYTAVDPGCAPSGCSVLTLMTLAPWNFADTWGTGGDVDGYRRRPRYRRLKLEAADRLLDRAERLIPGLRQSIQVMEVGTPLTNWRYSRNPGGSIYGREQTPHNMFFGRHSPKTPIPNLLFTGAWIAGGGMSTAMASGRTTASIAAKYLASG
ncbi:MAG: phytoene desaturase family protein [Acidimicrobiia bacterium]